MVQWLRSSNTNNAWCTHCVPGAQYRIRARARFQRIIYDWIGSKFSSFFIILFANVRWHEMTCCVFHIESVCLYRHHPLCFFSRFQWKKKLKENREHRQVFVSNKNYEHFFRVGSSSFGPPLLLSPIPGRNKNVSALSAYTNDKLSAILFALAPLFTLIHFSHFVFLLFRFFFSSFFFAVATKSLQNLFKKQLFRMQRTYQFRRAGHANVKQCVPFEMFHVRRMRCTFEKRRTICGETESTVLPKWLRKRSGNAKRFQRYVHWVATAREIICFIFFDSLCRRLLCRRYIPIENWRSTWSKASANHFEYTAASCIQGIVRCVAETVSQSTREFGQRNWTQFAYRAG